MIKRVYTLTQSRLRELILEDLRKHLGHAPRQNSVIVLSYDGGTQTEALIDGNRIIVTIDLD